MTERLDEVRSYYNRIAPRLGNRSGPGLDSGERGDEHSENCRRPHAAASWSASGGTAKAGSGGVSLGRTRLNHASRRMLATTRRVIW